MINRLMWNPRREVDMNDGEMLTLGIASLRLTVQPHHLAKLCDRKAIPFARAGRFRLVRVADFDQIRKALMDAGYLRDEASGTRPAEAAPT